LPVYVLRNGVRVVGRTSFTEAITSIKGGGGLEKYLGVASLKPFIDLDLVLERMVAFRIPEVEGLEKDVKGLPADLVIDVCKGFAAALEAAILSPKEHPMTNRQMQMAVKTQGLGRSFLRHALSLHYAAKSGKDQSEPAPRGGRRLTGGAGWFRLCAYMRPENRH